MKLRILADDLTGALDSAAAFAGETPVHLDSPGDDADGVSVVATATRDVPADELPALLAPARDWLRGADLAFKKVDSLLRGSTLAECAWLAQGCTRLVFAPAFPRQGRFTTDGRAWVLQPGAAAPQPIGDGSIAEGLAALGIADAWVPEVRSDDDLHAVASRSLEAASRGWLWCGSAGLAHALAAVHDLAPRPLDAWPASGPLLLVTASHHPVLRRQLALLRAASHAPRCEDLASAEALTPAQAARHLVEGVQRIVADVPRPGTLVVIGGDTLRALCRATGTTSLRARAAARSGWGLARLVGGRWDGVTCHTRSGAFGADDDLLEAVRGWA